MTTNKLYTTLQRGVIKSFGGFIALDAMALYSNGWDIVINTK